MKLDKLRILTGIIMIGGLVGGVFECNSITERAESNIHEIFAIATAAAWFIFGYVLARAIENIVEWRGRRIQKGDE